MIESYVVGRYFVSMRDDSQKKKKTKQTKEGRKRKGKGNGKLIM
jgi:hypothetical protein